MPADERFIIRAYREGDERAILDLFARSFHAPRSVAHFDWKYRKNPWGNERISLAFSVEPPPPRRRTAGEEPAAPPSDELAGHYAGYMVPFRDSNRDLLAHQIGDTMTEPSIRHIGRGPTSILGRTALHFYEHFCEGKIAFNYGFNVANIQKFSLRFLRSDRVEPVTYRIRDLRGDPLKPLPRASRWLRGWQLELVRDVDREWDEFFERVSPSYAFLVKRDATYVRWRHLEKPENDSIVVAIRKWRRLAGWAVFRIRENRLTIGDLLIDPHIPGALEVLLRHVVPRFTVDAVEGWFPPRPAWLDAILHEHFQTAPEPQNLSLMCVPFVKTSAVERMREALYYTWADSDLF